MARGKMPTYTAKPSVLPVNPTATDVKIEFGRRLQAAMLEAGWNQSELARRAAVHMPDGKFGRDLISDYINGRGLPQPLALSALAKAFGKDVEELRPVGAYPALDTNAPRMIIREDADGRMWLDIKRTVDWAVGVKILELLKDQPR